MGIVLAGFSIIGGVILGLVLASVGTTKKAKDNPDMSKAGTFIVLFLFSSFVSTVLLFILGIVVLSMSPP